MNAIRQAWEGWGKRVGAYVAACATLVGLLVLTIVVTSRKDTTNRESALWTFILFAIGLAVSFYFGRKSLKDAASELVRPQAKGAARRLVTLGRGVAGLESLMDLNREAAQESAERNAGAVRLEQVELAYDIMVLYMRGQLETIADALEDWREFEPEIVNQLQDQLEHERAGKPDN